MLFSRATHSSHYRMLLTDDRVVFPAPQNVLQSKYATLASLSANAMQYRGELMTALGASMQYKTLAKDVWSAKVQAARGKVGVNVRYKSGTKEWLGLAGLLPLASLLLERLGVLQ